MATKKQRRRRAKEQRHDYVWIDDEGKEVEGTGSPADREKAQSRVPGGRRMQRQQQAPSWERTLRRAAIFAPIMFATVYLLSPDLPIVTKITQTLFIVAIFIPFSYFLDRIFYRNFQRRQPPGDQPAGRRGS